MKADDFMQVRYTPVPIMTMIFASRFLFIKEKERQMKRQRTEEDLLKEPKHESSPSSRRVRFSIRPKSIGFAF
jgi:hypothetical protein